MITATVPGAISSAQRHRRALFGVALAATLSLVAALLIVNPIGASAAEIAFDQCNGIGGGGGQTVECDVVIVNNLTDDPATTGSTISVNGGAPVASSDIIVSVNQCNGSAEGGGSILACSVDITNNITQAGAAAAGAITVNQCNANQPDGLGTAPATCNPFPATTSGATVTQCNGSGNGGGLIGTSSCTASGTVSASLVVLVNQCNNSANGGGSAVNCSVSMSTNVIDTAAPPTTAPGEGGGTPGVDTPGQDAPPAQDTPPVGAPPRGFTG